MSTLITPRAAARLALASALVMPLTQVIATAAPPATHHHHAHATGGLCDGHKWSLFGCRPDPGHHRGEEPDVGSVD